MQSWLFSLLAKFVNADVIGGWVRTVVAVAFGALSVWASGHIPVLSAFISDPATQAWVGTTLTAVAVAGWSWLAKLLTAPTAIQTKAVAVSMQANGLITATTANAIKVDPTIAMPATPSVSQQA